ncbi:phospholipase D-like protein [Glaciihabitans tibetensis]|uniref:Phospholipase D-like protein n=1 Tax=Glaciihabitans tibetensis TaxID=1266600 RepID=A0A2T0VH20_9MICO|nr:SHOCT domain-containing protein [Glaciihabitans tibetensis]PRY69517.1 phospholipase D-like protein [Glaciihabitans tibetensis]
MNFWDNFWDIIGWFFWIFVFTAYLMALFGIIADVFRDRELSGFGKAAWILFLVFFPFITALVYLIARGRGMAERNMRQAEAAQHATDDYIRTVAGSSGGSSASDEIAKAKSLLDQGTITSGEYNNLKEKALAHSN